MTAGEVAGLSGVVYSGFSAKSCTQLISKSPATCMKSSPPCRLYLHRCTCAAQHVSSGRCSQTRLVGSDVPQVRSGAAVSTGHGP